MAEPLKIGVEVNVADIPKLSAAAQQVLQDVRSLNEQFVQGAITSEQLIAGIKSASAAYVAATPGLTAQISKLAELKAVQESFQTAAKESAKEIFGPIGAQPKYLENYAGELKSVELASQLVGTGQKQLATSIAGVAPPIEAAAGASKASAQASIQQAVETRESQAAMSQAGRAALEMSQAMLSGSEAVQTSSRTFIGLTRDLAIATEALLETKAAMLETGLSAEQAAALEAKYSQQLIDVAVLTKAATDAEVQYKAALSESYTTQQAAADTKAKAAAQQSAALLQKQQAEQADADAAAQETAANEGMVASDVEVANTANVAAEARANYRAKVLEAAEANQQAAVAEQGNTTALADVGAVSANTASQAELLAQKLVRGGMAAAEVSSILKNNFNLSAKEAATVLAGVGNTSNQVNPQLAALINRATSLAENMRTAGAATKQFQQSAGEIRSALSNMGLSAQETAKVMAQLAQQLDPGKVEQFTRQLAYSAIRMGATEGQVGQLGFAFARLGSIMPGVASLFAAAFPIFAAIAAIQIIGQLSTKMEEWRDAEQKAADEAAKFERAIIQSSEAVARMEEKLAGAVGPLAEVEERMANISGKAINLSSDIELMNKHLADAPGMWTKLGGGIAGVYFALTGLFRSSAEDSRVQIDLFTRSLADSVKTAADLPRALAAIDVELQNVTASMEHYKTSQLISPEAGTIKNFEDQITALKGMRTIIENEQQASNLERLTEQQSLEEKLTTVTESAQRARISLAESHSKEKLKLNQISESQEITEEVNLQKQLTSIQLTAVSERESRLAAVKRLQPTVDFSAQEEAFQEERIRIRTDGQKRVDEIVAAGDAKIASENLTFRNAEIQGEEKVTLAYMKREEARLRVALNKADTPATIEAAAIPLIQQTTEQYEKETAAIKARAEALVETKLPTTAPLPTANLGTMDFTQQIADIQKKFPTLATEVYTQLIQMNSEMMAIRERGAQEEEAIEQAKTDKIRTYHREELTNNITELNDRLIVERDSYQRGLAALQGSLLEHTSSWSRYFSSVQALAEKNRSEQQAIFNEERALDQAAADARVITAEELQRRLEAVRKREEQATKQMYQRIEEAAKQAIEREERDIDRVSKKIADDFASAARELLTTHESIGRAAMKLGQQLELYIIEQGIKRVVTRYATALLQMAADDNSFVTRSIGIHTAGAAAQNALLHGQTVQAAAQNTAQTVGVVASKTAQTAATATATAAQTTTVAVGQTAQTAAVAAGQTAQTAAVTAGTASRSNIGLIEDIKSIGRAAATAAAHAFKWVMEEVPFPINVVLAPAAAAAAFAGVLAFGGGIGGAEGGTVVSAAGGMQSAQAGPASRLVISAAGGMYDARPVLVSAADGTIVSSAAGGLHAESQQFVPSAAAGSVVAVPSVSKQFISSATDGITMLPAAASGTNIPSAAIGVIVPSAALGSVVVHPTTSAAAGRTVTPSAVAGMIISAAGGTAIVIPSAAAGVIVPSAAAGSVSTGAMTIVPSAAMPSAAGGMSEGAQPVLVHSGEVITNISSLHNMASAAGGAVAMAKVPSDQVSMLSPGSVVVPRSMAGGLASAAGGVSTNAPGIPPPLGLRESPQRLPSSMAGMIQGIIAKSAVEGLAVPYAADGMVASAAGGATSPMFSAIVIPHAAGGVAIPSVTISAAGGVIVPSAARGIVVPSGTYFSAAGGIAVPSASAMPTLTRTMSAAGGVVIPSGGAMSQKSLTNHVKIEYHSHDSPGIQREHLPALVSKAIRRGQLNLLEDWK